VVRTVGLLLALLAVTACAAPAAAPAATSKPAEAAPAATSKPAEAAPAATSKPAAAVSEAEWQRVVAAAKKEGKVSLVTHPSTQWSGWVAAFKEAYPDIKVEHLPMRPSDVTPRILSEQQNNQFLYDVMVGPTSNSVKSLTPAGAFQDIRSFFVLPEAVDDARWNGGLDVYADKDQFFNLVTSMTITNATLVNRKLAPKADFATLDDLLKPQFKGKIAIYDPTAPNNGSFATAYLIKNKGEEFARKVLDNSVIIESSPDVTNFVQSGRYAIGLGSDPQQFAKLQEQGRAADLELNDLLSFAAASGIAVLKNAPNPDAARVVVNWFMSQEGQEAYARLGQTNSRRLGVASHLGEAPGYAEPDWNNLGSVLRPNEAVGIEFVDRAIQLAKETRH
jgi:ABC-type Fe3+ transport system substrate-binding protein